jgi:hypothetical protein
MKGLIILQIKFNSYKGKARKDKEITRGVRDNGN